MYYIKRQAHRASSPTTGWGWNPYGKIRVFKADGSSTERLAPSRIVSNDEFGRVARDGDFSFTKERKRHILHTGTAPADFASPETSPISPISRAPDTLTNTASTDETTSNPKLQEKEDPSPSSAPTPAQPSKMKRLLPSWMQRRRKQKVDDPEKGGKAKKPERHFGFWPQIEAIFFSWINILLILAPVGIGLGAANANGYAVFIVNFVAIMPLAGLLSFATEELALRVGDTLGGLLNASFGNAVELIVSVIALSQNQIIIVQTSLIGSMLSNLLLVLGMCFFFGGINREKQNFNVQVAQTSASLLSIAVASLIIPTTFHRWGLPATEQQEGGKTFGPDQREAQVPELSRGIAVILLVVYGCYLFFQLKTHRSLFKQVGAKEPTRKASKELPAGATQKSIAMLGGGLSGPGLEQGQTSELREQINNTEQPMVDDVDDEEDAKISVTAALITLLASTAFIGICSEYMVDGIKFVVQQGGVSPEFIGLILIPIVGNAAEHATAVTVAIKDKMDLAIGVAVGSSLQISLFVLPAVVIIGWGLGNNAMTLEFDGFLIALLFVSMLLVNYLIQDGSSHWLEGVQLMLLYVMIAVAAWFYPQTEAVVG